MDTVSAPLNLIQPGDLLTYWSGDLFDWIIRIKTWHKIAHVESFVGNMQSVASRNGIGVGQFHLRTEGLNGIYRPTKGINLAKGWEYFKTVAGQGYDWFGLLAFTSFTNKGERNKQFCSEFLTNYYRECGLEPVAIQESPVEVAPFELAESPSFSLVWANP